MEHDQRRALRNRVVTAAEPFLDEHGIEAMAEVFGTAALMAMCGGLQPDNILDLFTSALAESHRHLLLVEMTDANGATPDVKGSH